MWQAGDVWPEQYLKLIELWARRHPRPKKVAAYEIGQLALSAELFMDELATIADDRRKLGAAMAALVKQIVDQPLGAWVVRRRERAMPDKGTAYLLEPFAASKTVDAPVDPLAQATDLPPDLLS